ncbi:MAG: ABC transporter permease [Gammaproteobacteria bacterium RIFCSPLOWO2_02_FULL_61_13]|nr:MAG: ABC transporter permease [Gammaproteobacteria bacterium RIFCSPLOWO2_02_FULL_61_13]
MVRREVFKVAFATIVRKEVNRFVRIWPQTILPPAVSMALYFVIFGNLIGTRVGQMDGFSYIDFIAPGLIMMSVMNNAYANVVSSFFGAKFQHHVEEMLVAPIPNWVILAGYITGGVLRGLAVGVVVTAIAMCFTHLRVSSVLTIIAILLLTTVLFSLGGMVNAIYAKKFDDISIIPTFLLTPLIYLGGVFYSIDLLPPFWKAVSYANPIVYMVDAFRYGLLGTSHTHLGAAFAIITLFVIALGGYALTLLERGTGIKS